MTTTTIEPGTVTVVDVDLEAVPICDAYECVGDRGPAVCRGIVIHRCEHRDPHLLCDPCREEVLQKWWRLVRLVCAECADEHLCVLAAHVELRPL